MTISIVVPSDYNVVRNASVAAPTQIVLEWYPDTGADIEKYTVLRSEDNINFSNLVTTDIAPLTTVETYNDNSAFTNSKSYYYKTISIDSCENEFTSGTVRTILLTGADNANFTNTLDWNAFEITNGTVINYNIYRDAGAGFGLHTTVSGTTDSYTDDVAAFVNLVDIFCYQVEAVFQLNAPENGVNEQLVSLSNSICVEQGPRIYVPNAIVPDGLNAIFKPVIIYGTEEGYSMKIFNRYGQIIFETTDVNEGWTGAYENEIVPMGTYVYLISFTATNGQVITKKGNVTVVR
jgi:gliding motility-associated-like protein